MKKIIIISVIVLILVIGGLIVFGVSSKRTNAPAVVTGVSAGPTAGDGGIESSKVFPNAPKTPTMVIQTPAGGVTINNFYLGNPTVVEGGIVIIKKTPDYSITYSESDGAFWLMITGTSFDTARGAAESDFLTTLGLKASDACKLAVTSGIPYDAGNPLSGRSFPPTFCVKGAFSK